MSESGSSDDSVNIVDKIEAALSRRGSLLYEKKKKRERKQLNNESDSEEEKDEEESEEAEPELDEEGNPIPKPVKPEPMEPLDPIVYEKRPVTPRQSKTEACPVARDLRIRPPKNRNLSSTKRADLIKAKKEDEAS